MPFRAYSKLRLFPEANLHRFKINDQRAAATPHSGGRQLRAPSVETYPLLLSDLPPTKQQIRLIATMAIVLALAAAAVLPFRAVQWPILNVFIPIVDTILLFSDLVTAILFYAIFSISRSRSMLALATGYFFTALIIIPHALTFPGAFAETGLFGAGVNTTIWLYYFWHAGLPLAVIAYAYLRNTDNDTALPSQSVPFLIASSVVGSCLVVVALTILATAGQHLLPGMMFDAIHWSSGRLLYVAVPLLGLLLLAMGLLWYGKRSLLDLWLMLMLWAWTIELILVTFTSSRYSLLWYTGRTYGLLSGVFVLMALLSATTNLYARLAASVAARQQERESRLMTMDAVAGSIAHEVNQPLSAIVSNANAGLRWLARDPPDIERLHHTLQAIASDGHRAADVVTSIRSMFGRKSCERHPLNINEVIGEAVKLVSSEIEGHQIALKMRLTSGLPLVCGDRVQLKQVFLNLLSNAMDALGDAPGRRVLSVRSRLDDSGSVLVSIRDTGHGIRNEELDLIFDPFFTRKANGTGLGLSICRSIIDNHGGRLWATAGAMQGSTFHLSLPSR